MTEAAITLEEGRFSRLEAIQWWDQSLIREGRVLVVGAGALGNEVIKNMALLGIGHVIVVDMDRVELSNLSRSVLFRAADEGQPKAECAARAAQQIYPEMRVQPLVGNVLSEVGLGYFRWARVVIGALDNREARVFVNAACARVERPWIDGGIEVLQGIVRGFAPPATACYECTMSGVDWDLLNERRSCSLLARRALRQRGTPTTPTTASVVGAIQTQEAVKLLHGMEAHLGRGFFFDGASHNSYSVTYPINPDCGWHDDAGPIEAMDDVTSDTPLRIIWERASRRLGRLDALDLARELVECLECPSCGKEERVLAPADRITEEQVICARCGTERVPSFFHSVSAGSELLELSARKIGLPPWDIVWARSGTASFGIEISGDRVDGQC